jgi:hypothetical protein
MLTMPSASGQSERESLLLLSPGLLILPSEPDQRRLGHSSFSLP